MNKNHIYEYIGLIISVIFLFAAFLYRDKDLKVSAIELFFVLGMMMFNYGIPVIYRSLKKNHWNYALAKNNYNYMFTNTGVIVVTILFILFLPSTLILFLDHYFSVPFVRIVHIRFNRQRIIAVTGISKTETVCFCW